MRPVKKDSTDQSVVIRIIDSTDGTPETGVEHDTAGIDLWYRREGATKTSITEAALAALDSEHSDGGIEHIGDGYYRLDLPDAAVATGSNGVMVGGTVTGMIVMGCYISLVDYDPYDSVRAGLTALPNAAADAAGGLPVSDAGGLDIDNQKTAIVDEFETQSQADPTGFHVNVKEVNGTAQTANDNGADINAILTDTNEIQGKLPTNKFMGSSDGADDDGTLNTIAGDVVNIDGDAMRGTDGANTTVPDAAGTAPTASEIQAEMEENGASILDTLQDRLTAARAGYLDELAAANIPADLDAVLADTNELQTDLTNGGRLDLLIDAIKAVTDNLPDSGALNDLATILVDTNELQTDWTNGGRLDLLIDAILADTNELQGDWANGGRLDLLLDAVKAVTDNLPDSGSLNDLATILTDTNELQGLISASKLPAQVKGIDADVITASALADDAGNEIADQVADEEYDNDGTAITLRGAIKLILAILTAKSSGGGGTTLTFRDINDSKDRLVVTVDANGNRSAVGTRDAT